jgi:probable HAF family extracellular repeat protein
MQDLGTLGGGFSHGRDINDLGQVTGGSYLNGISKHAFFWNGSSMQDLGTLGGTDSLGLGINNAGQVVGYSQTMGNAADHAFLWSAGVGMVDLNTFAPADWTLGFAVGISDSGIITGFGTNPQGQDRAFLLSPTATAVPEPGIAALGAGAAAFGLIALRRRRPGRARMRV